MPWEDRKRETFPMQISFILLVAVKKIVIGNKKTGLPNGSPVYISALRLWLAEAYITFLA
jgi:hypothetical protein